MRNIILLFACLLLGGCLGDFGNLNKNPEGVSNDEFNFKYLFTTAQLRTATCGDNGIDNWRSNLYHCEMFIQHFASLVNTNGSWQGDKYFYKPEDNVALWARTYGFSTVHSNAGKLIVDVLENTRNNEEYHNLYQMARIWRVFIFHRLTDLYGDIPYKEACRGYYDLNFAPKYDAQRDIYLDMLNELSEVVTAFDENKDDVGESDIVYKGDISKWKKFAYSMMLRLGMRMSKVQPDLAKEWVKKAFEGGVMADNLDNCFIRMTDKTGSNQTLVNGESWALSDKAKAEGKLSEVFVGFLKENQDPRLKYMAAIYENPNDATYFIADPTVQKGLPNGYDRISIEQHSSWDASHRALEHQYSAINREVFGQFDGPCMFLTYAEVCFLLSEASVRGWISGDAEFYYNEGVRASMENLQNYNEKAIITNEEINVYLVNHPFIGLLDVERAYEQINTQYWVSTFLNGYEAFANWRRSGYPVLVPVNYPGNVTNGTIPRRCRYPESEIVHNENNYREAIARQGADEFTTRVWWDK